MNEYEHVEDLNIQSMVDVVVETSGYSNTLRKPRPNESVQVFMDVYARIMDVDDENGSVTITPFPGMDSPPYSSSLVVVRSKLFFDPRGFWSHIVALRQMQASHDNKQSASNLFRQNNGVAASGMPRGASVPNLQVPIGLLDKVKRSTEDNNFDSEGRQVGVNKLSLFR